MIVRGTLRCIRSRPRCNNRWTQPPSRATRQFSSSIPNPAPTGPQSSMSILGSLTTELDRIAPRFEVPSSQIRILRSPAEFYETLKTKILTAQRRIYLSTLYFGAKEHELINTIRIALQKNPDLKISILTDGLRGTRETPKATCASLLAPLIDEFGDDRVEIRMFHTPNLTGIRKAVVPRRINEGWGLTHMKLYGIDDEIFLSGANLSSDYFTDRQDRYHIFSSAELTEYFARIHHGVCKLSFAIHPDKTSESGYSMTWPVDNPSKSPLEDTRAFKQQATATLGSLMKLNTIPLPSQYSTQIPSTDRFSSLPTTVPPPGSHTTLVYPLFQFTSLLSPDTSTELPALRTILKSLATPAFTGSTWTFTSGYFNMTPEFRRLLLRTVPTCSSGTVIAASPWANGFYASKGVSGMLPDAYTYLSSKFLNSVSIRGLGEWIRIKEWRRGVVNTPGGWSYHAKGIWVTLPEEQDVGPSICVVGSSNYTKRSYNLDLEANVLMLTRDPDLQRRLREEETWLQEYATEMTKEDYEKEDRKVSFKVRAAMFLVTILGGAL